MVKTLTAAAIALTVVVAATASGAAVLANGPSVNGLDYNRAQTAGSLLGGGMKAMSIALPARR